MGTIFPVQTLYGTVGYFADNSSQAGESLKISHGSFVFDPRVFVLRPHPRLQLQEG